MKYSKPIRSTVIHAYGLQKDYTIRKLENKYTVEIAPNDCNDEFQKDNLTEYYSLAELATFISELEEIKKKIEEGHLDG